MSQIYDQEPAQAAQTLRESLIHNEWTKLAQQAVVAMLNSYDNGEANWTRAERSTGDLNRAAIRLAERCHDDPTLRVLVIIRDGVLGRTEQSVQVELAVQRWIDAHKTGDLNQPEMLAAIQRLDNAATTISRQVKVNPARRMRVAISLVRVEDKP